MLSDFLQAQYGADSMRYALLSLVVIGVWSTWHYWRAGIHLPADLARADDPT